MTAALSDHSLDQIFRSARTFNGWTDRPVEDATVREIYDLMKWGPTSANCSPARFVWVRSVDGKTTLAGLAAEPNKAKILQAPSRSLLATTWISPASSQSFCLTLLRPCSSTLRHRAWPR
jgi:nitroreductase